MSGHKQFFILASLAFAKVKENAGDGFIRIRALNPEC
jgi:hypothetical protein